MSTSRQNSSPTWYSISQLFLLLTLWGSFHVQPHTCSSVYAAVVLRLSVSPAVFNCTILELKICRLLYFLLGSFFLRFFQQRHWMEVEDISMGKESRSWYFCWAWITYQQVVLTKELQLLTVEVGYSPKFLLPGLAVGIIQRNQQ